MKTASSKKIKKASKSIKNRGRSKTKSETKSKKSKKSRSKSAKKSLKSSMKKTKRQTFMSPTLSTPGPMSIEKNYMTYAEPPVLTTTMQQEP